MELKLLIIGFGRVGRGFAELLIAKRKTLQQQFGLNCSVVAIVTRRSGAIVDERGLDLSKALKAARNGRSLAEAGPAVKNVSTIDLLSNLDYDVLAELSATDIETGEPATSFIKQALNRGRHVITTNKGPVALHLNELQKLAGLKGAVLRYEGTVMSGTPLLNLIRNNLAALSIRKIRGIVNGSCNYILTRMEEGLSYDQAVEEAGRSGYLEADPTADVEGWDAAAKLMILSQAAFGVRLKTEEVERRGITNLTRKDAQQAKSKGKVWKLIATLEKTENGVEAKVGPEMIDLSHPLAAVRGVTNAVTISTDYLQDVTIAGPGAGNCETGYAVLNDLLACAHF
ncbi:MAG: homoserine dehydrogenase [Calditrichaeota bacterium]|nr:homoserine dehydrogenase [Calditrichota bacterium]